MDEAPLSPAERARLVDLQKIVREIVASLSPGSNLESLYIVAISPAFVEKMRHAISEE